MAHLFILNGSARYRAFPLADGAFVIGKGEGVDIRIADAWVSGRHARLRREGARYVLEDLGSTNGTFVNLERVAPDEPRELAEDDVVFLGGTHVLVVTADRLPSAPPRPGRAPRAAPSGHHDLTHRMQRRPDEIDVSPLALGDADDSDAAAATSFIDPDLLDSVDLDSLEAEAEDVDAFRAPPPTARELAELDQVLLSPRPIRQAPPAATKGLGAAPVTDGPDASDSGPLDAISGSLEIDLDELLGTELAQQQQSPPAAAAPVASRPAAAPALAAGRAAAPGAAAAAAAAAAGTPAGASRPAALREAVTEPERRAESAAEGRPAAAGLAGQPAQGDPIALRDREIARLRGLLSARDAEIQRLREENLRLKERYLDL